MLIVVLVENYALRIVTEVNYSYILVSNEIGKNTERAHSNHPTLGKMVSQSNSTRLNPYLALLFVSEIVLGFISKGPKKPFSYFQIVSNKIGKKVVLEHFTDENNQTFLVKTNWGGA